MAVMGVERTIPALFGQGFQDLDQEWYKSCAFCFSLLTTTGDPIEALNTFLVHLPRKTKMEPETEPQTFRTCEPSISGEPQPVCCISA